ncbi:MAG: hypothetical protein WAO22_05315 [bacterium]|jgi:hypothetical protein
MWHCGHGFGDGTRTLLKVDLRTGEILINHLDEFWSRSDYVTSSRKDEPFNWIKQAGKMK